jgi:hypothetical protein
MAYLWKHRKEKGAEPGYKKAAGDYAEDFLPKGMGELAAFCKQLGMPSAEAKSTAVVEELLTHSPLVIWQQREKSSHVMPLTGFSERNWYYIDPQVMNGDAPSTQHTFGEHSYDSSLGIHYPNTVITPKGAWVNGNQSSWHASLLRRPGLFGRPAPPERFTACPPAGRGSSTGRSAGPCRERPRAVARPGGRRAPGILPSRLGLHPRLPLVPARLAAVLRLDGRRSSLLGRHLLPPPEGVVGTAAGRTRPAGGSWLVHP